MMELVPITANSPQLSSVRTLYERAFPENERRPLSELLATSSPNAAETLALYDGALFCGFAILLNGDNGISHIIYLAIEESLRDRGYGSRALQALHAYKHPMRIIVDIERETATASNNDQRRKRKRFYLRNGYEPTSIRYRWRRESYEILSFGGPVSNEEYEAFWSSL